VAELAAVAGTIEILAEQGPVTGPIPWTPAQLNFLEHGHPNPDFHTIGILMEPKDGDLQPHLLERAMEHVMRHHDHLRVRTVGEGKDMHLVIDPPGAPVNMLLVDLSGLPEEARLRELRIGVRKLVVSCKMSEGNLVRTALFGMEPGKVNFLHIATQYMSQDINSLPIMLDDLDAAYRNLEAGKPVEMPRKTTSAKQWAERLAQRALPGGMPQQELDYWLAQAPHNPPRFPMDHEIGPNTWVATRFQPMELDLEETRILLQQVPRFLGVQIDAVLVTAVLSAFESWVGTRSLPIHLLGHGREALYDDMDLTRTVGWFNTIYPVLLDMGPDPDPVASARELNRQLRRIPHGGTGFGILRYLSSDPDVVAHMNKALEPQVFFNYLGPDNTKELGRLSKVDMFGGYHQDRHTRRFCPITIGAYVIQDKMLIKWEHNTNLHKVETVKALAQRCGDVLRWFVNDYRTRGAGAAS
jgi:non-ribosomal peptide synthase protein (TIGR01720 family)